MSYYTDKTNEEQKASASTFSMKDAMQNALSRAKDNKENQSGDANSSLTSKGPSRSKETRQRTKQNPDIFVGVSRKKTVDAECGEVNEPLRRTATVPLAASSGDIRRKSKYSKRARMLNPSICAPSSSQNARDRGQIMLNAPPKNGNAKMTGSSSEHRGFDESFKKLRKLQDENADLSRPIDRHKRKKKAITRKHGFDGLCKGLMSDDLYMRYEETMKEWRGLDCNDINFANNKKRVLRQILDIFVECCNEDIRTGHMSKFRNLSCGFDKRLTNRGDKVIYRDLMLNHVPQLQGYLNNLRAQQKERC